MKRIAVGFGFLVTVIAMTLMNANGQDCPSGHYYRMSGRCADASGHKVYGASKNSQAHYIQKTARLLDIRPGDHNS